MKWNVNNLKKDFLKALQSALQPFSDKQKSFNCIHFISDVGNGAFYIYVSTIEDFKHSTICKHFSATEDAPYTTGEFSDVLNSQATSDGFIIIENSKSLKLPEKVGTSDRELTEFFTKMGVSILDEILLSKSDHEEVKKSLKENLKDSKCIFIFSDDEVSYSEQFRAFVYDKEKDVIEENH
jgi:hypothetical protein